MRSDTRTLHFPAGPLADAIRSRANSEESMDAVAQIVADRLNRSAESMQRIIYKIFNARTVTLRVMDDWCVGLGKHPIEVYGHDYEVTPDEDS